MKAAAERRATQTVIPCWAHLCRSWFQARDLYVAECGRTSFFRRFRWPSMIGVKVWERAEPRRPGEKVKRRLCPKMRASARVGNFRKQRTMAWGALGIVLAGAFAAWALGVRERATIVTVKPSETYQVMTGWEVTARAWETEQGREPLRWLLARLPRRDHRGSGRRGRDQPHPDRNPIAARRTRSITGPAS